MIFIMVGNSVCGFINEAESTRYKETVTQRATWPLCPVTPPLTLLCRFTCVSDTHHWPSSPFDETLAEEREHKVGSLWCHVYEDGLESRWSAAWRFVSPHFTEALMAITVSPGGFGLRCSQHFCNVKIQLPPTGCGCNALLFADIRDAVCLPW